MCVHPTCVILEKSLNVSEFPCPYSGDNDPYSVHVAQLRGLNKIVNRYQGAL